MSELLKTKGIGSEVENLIITAKKYLCIFTYSIVVDPIYIERLRSAVRRGVDISIVIGLKSKNSDTLKQIISIPGCKVYFKECMHAKFYYNEEKLIIASMNLSEVSGKKNYEIGLLFSRESNSQLFNAIREEAREIVHNAELLSIKSVNSEKPIVRRISEGHCIRCNNIIPYNPAKPLCDNCYEEWARWGNVFYREVLCHMCGFERDFISYARPECRSCYSKSFQ